MVDDTGGAHQGRTGARPHKRAWAVIAKFDIKEGCEQEWLDLVRNVVAAMRHEPTFISTSLCAHPDEPGKFMLFEVWEDRDEFFTVQVNRDYRKPYMARLPELAASAVTFEEWTDLHLD